MDKLKIGIEHTMVFPFVSNTFAGVKYWRPGCNVTKEADGSGYGMEVYFDADSEGKVIYRVLSIASMPKPFQDRIIFKRWLINPDGKRHNNGEVRMLTKKSFLKDINSRTPFKVDYELEYH